MCSVVPEWRRARIITLYCVVVCVVATRGSVYLGGNGRRGGLTVRRRRRLDSSTSPCYHENVANGERCVLSDRNLIDLIASAGSNVSGDEECLLRALQNSQCSDFVFTNGIDVCKCDVGHCTRENTTTDVHLYEYNRCGECQNTNAGSAAGLYGINCQYFENKMVHCENEDYNDDDFNAQTHCCACGGGNVCRVPTYVNPGNCTGQFLDSADVCVPSCTYPDSNRSFHRVGTTRCLDGTLEETAVCLDAPCNMSAVSFSHLISVTGCDGMVESGTVCPFECEGTLEPQGAIRCQNGVPRTDVRCVRGNSCVDGDSNGETDVYSRACHQYTAGSAWCGQLDDDDFDANSICCSCGGSKNGTCTRIPHYELQGTCSNVLASGTACTPECPNGATPNGTTRCFDGIITETASCTNASCRFADYLPSKTVTYDPVSHAFVALNIQTPSRLVNCSNVGANIHEGAYPHASSCTVQCQGPFMNYIGSELVCENGGVVIDTSRAACAYMCSAAEYWDGNWEACQSLFARVEHVEDLLDDPASPYNTPSDIPAFVRHVDLKGSSIRSSLDGAFALDFPTRWFPGFVDELDLSINSISDVGRRTFVQMTELTILRLNTNHLTQLDEEAFAGLENLRVLDLGSNRLTHVGNSLASLSNLRMLYLETNALVRIEFETFRQLSRVTYMDISKNDLEFIDPSAFDAMSFLVDDSDEDTQQTSAMLLSQNPKLGTQFVADLFNTSCTGLYHLSLENCNIVRIAPLLFEACVTLSILKLSHNSISSIEANQLRGLRSVQSLYLNDNQISRIEGLSEMPALQNLRLQTNSMKELTAGMFDGLDQLATLDLSDNPLTSIPPGVFDSVPLLWKLTLQGTHIIHVDPATMSQLCGRDVQSLSSVPLSTDVFALDMFPSPSTCTCVAPSSIDGGGNTSIDCQCLPISTTAPNNTGCLQRDDVSVAIVCGSNTEGGCASDLRESDATNCPSMGSDAAHLSTEGGDEIRIFGVGTAGDADGTLVKLETTASASSSPCYARKDSNGTWVCNMPAGTGLGHKMRLTYSFLVANVRMMIDLNYLHECTFDYAAPTIVGIGGCDNGVCSREGGDVITIEGNNFGSRDALVFINQWECANTTHICDDSKNATMCNRRIECVLPPLRTPQSSTNFLRVFQSNQADSWTLLRYRECSVDTFQSQQSIDGSTVVYVCADCPYGKSTYGETDALSCASCETLYLGSARCDVPVLGILFGCFAAILIVASGYVTYRKCEKIRRSNEELLSIVQRQKLLIRAKSTDIALLGSAWELRPHEVRFDSKIAAGAQGSVHLGALHEKWIVAIKVLKNDDEVSNGSSSGGSASSSSSSSRHNAIDLSALISSEVQFLIRTRHERLVMFLGCGVLGNGDVFIVSEFMEGGSLDRYVWDPDASKIRWSQKIQVLRDVASGLMFLHLVHKSIHRDVKSSNVLLSGKLDSNTSDVRGKLGDFGMSTIVSRGKRRIRTKMFREGSSTTSWVKENMVGMVGTIQWMAPECMQTDHVRYGPLADVYSFGIVMWEMWALEKPWRSIGTRDIVDSVLKGKRPLVPASSSPRGYESAMRQCWDSVIANRPTIDAIDAILQDMQHKIAKRETQDSKVSPDQSSDRKKRGMPSNEQGSVANGATLIELGPLADARVTV